MSGDSYSRMVSFLKLALPLVALGILSTLFLFSSKIDPGQSIPFADAEVVDRIRGQQVTGPFYAGVTSGGDRIAFTAKDLVTTGKNTNEADNVFARLDFAEGGSVELRAPKGELDMPRNRAVLSGNVDIISTDGFELQTERLTSVLSRTDIKSETPVHGKAPAGTIEAQKMHITAQENGKNVQILFFDGVKLLYEPQQHN